MATNDRLSAALGDIERGIFPPADGLVEVVRPPEGQAAVLGFSAHTLVVADVPQHWVDKQLPDGDLAAPMNPPFLQTLADRLHLRVNGIDLVAFGERLVGEPPVVLQTVHDSTHPRVARALRYRDDVRVYETEGGVVLLGRGLAGRWETAFEVDPAYRANGLGRRLAEAARYLVPDGPGVWAQVSPGNAASVRPVLAAGYRPVGSEALLVPADPLVAEGGRSPGY